MSDPEELEELVGYLVRTSRLSITEARRIVNEVLSFLDETPQAYVRRRHLELQAAGMANASIFPQLIDELDRLRFRATGYSERQIRRIIYG
jgi:hypothetical protein